MLIDASGLGCPKPVSMAQEALEKIDEEIIEVLVDNEASFKNIIKFAKKEGKGIETIKEDKCWWIKIIKGYVCDIERSEFGVRS